MKARERLVLNARNRQALAYRRMLTVMVNHYRRVRTAAEQLPPDLLEAFESVAVHQVTVGKFAHAKQITVARANGRIAAAFAMLNAELRIPPGTEIIK